MKEQEKYWTYRIGPIPEVKDLPKGAFAGTEADFQKLSPGFRREILRAALKIKEREAKS